MPIEQITPQAQVDEYLDEELIRREQALIYNFSYVAEKCINEARSMKKAGKDYKDQTGNLRSSIGYVIVNDGEIVQASSFAQIKQGGHGSATGSDFAKRLAKRYRKGIFLIMVAGMDYAIHVQNKGYDVLTSAELLAENLVPKLLKQLGFTK